MDAIVMAGGRGLRLGRGEKPLVALRGKPLISYVLDALRCSSKIGKLFVSTTPSSPLTRAWVSEHYEDVGLIDTQGMGFVRDMVFAVEASGTSGAVLIIMADLPLVTPALIGKIIDTYSRVDEPALSVHIPLSICSSYGIRPDTIFNRDGRLIVPVGINILDAGRIREEQPDYNYILNDAELAVNVNTTNDLRVCELICENRLRPD